MEIIEIVFTYFILLPATLYFVFHFYRVLFKAILFPFAILRFLFGRRDMRCTWCRSRKLKFLNGEVGNWNFTYTTKSGDQDLRYKNNPKVAGYNSLYRCKSCGAESAFRHVMTRKPSKKAKVWKGRNITEGFGTRKGSDYG